jgi:hypothetical protein
LCRAHARAQAFSDLSIPLITQDKDMYFLRELSIHDVVRALKRREPRLALRISQNLCSNALNSARAESCAAFACSQALGTEGIMLSWGQIVFLGLWLIRRDVNPVTKAKLIGNPMLIHVIVIGSGLWIHGGSADDAMAQLRATSSA